MAIEAICPNGHRISCPDDSHGRMAKCPKCGSPFRIPDTGGTTETGSGLGSSVALNPSPVNSAALQTESDHPSAIQSPASQSKLGQHQIDPALATLGSAENVPSVAHAITQTADNKNSDSKIADGKAKAKLDSIFFLCPSGHKLNGPSKLAGKLGQCPHCGQRFQIPTLEEIRFLEEQEKQAAQFGITPEVSSDMSQTVTSGEPEPELSIDEDESSTDQDDVIAHDTREQLPEEFLSQIGLMNENPVAVGADSPIHPLARLMYRLWGEREHGGIIELHLEGGTVYLPDWFERKLSAKSHGLFAAQSADGTVTMTIVPWDSVQRVVIRGVVGLPDGMFE